MKAPQTVAPTSNLPDVLVTDADKLREQYKSVGDAQGHQFGEGGPGAKPPNFNLRVEVPKPTQPSTTCGSRDSQLPIEPRHRPSPSRGPSQPRRSGPDGQPIAPRPTSSRASRQRLQGTKRTHRRPIAKPKPRRCRRRSDRMVNRSSPRRPTVPVPTAPSAQGTKRTHRRRSPSRNLPLPRRSDRTGSRSSRGQGSSAVDRSRPANQTNPPPAVGQAETCCCPTRSDRMGSRSLRGQKQRPPSTAPPANQTNPPPAAAKPKPTKPPITVNETSRIAWRPTKPAPRVKPAKPESSSPPPTQ